MLTAFLLLPIIAVGLAAPFVSGGFDWLPDWYECGQLSEVNDVAFLLFATLTAALFYRYEKGVVIQHSEAKQIVKRVKVASIASVMVLVSVYASGISLNIRDFCQMFSVNTLFNITKVMVVLYFFGAFGASKTFDVALAIIVGAFNALSGSKASMLIPVLIAIMVIKDRGYGALGVLFLALMLGLSGVIPHFYFVRYADIGLSAHQTAYIYQSTGIDLYPFHLLTVVNATEGRFGFNPVVEYLMSTNFAAGYNLTPTIVGEMMGSGIFIGFIILNCLMGCLSIGRRFFLSYSTPAVYGAWFFTFASTLQSSLLDVFFYNLYFITALVFVGIAKRGINLLGNLRGNLCENENISN